MPIRLNPDGEQAEVVWCRRIDPARAVVESLPLPESGMARGDMLLHDGAPTGYRLLNGQEVPVFDMLALLVPSGLSTFAAEILAGDPDALVELEAICVRRELFHEDWTGNIRWLCKACSEGRPHSEHEWSPAAAHWQSRRRIGIASADAAAAERALQEWAAATGSEVLAIRQALAR